MRFTDKCCIVTGGAAGIGRATAVRLAAEGAKVVVADIDETGGWGTVDLISKSQGEAIFVKADVSMSAEVQNVVAQAVAEFGTIDVLVNNAGIMAFKRVEDLADNEWDRVLAVNLRSVFLFCKYCVPHMERGAIVNVSSIHAHKTEATVSSYASSKGGIEAFTRALSNEFASSRIRVNCVAPGGVNTALLWENPNIKKMDPKDVSYFEPEDIAAVICFLASDEARAVNGSTIMADGGLLAAM